MFNTKRHRLYINHVNTINKQQSKSIGHHDSYRAVLFVVHSQLANDSIRSQCDRNGACRHLSRSGLCPDSTGHFLSANERGKSFIGLSYYNRRERTYLEICLNFKDNF